MNTFKIANNRPIVLSAITLALGIFTAGLVGSSAIGFFVSLSVLMVITIVSFFLKFKSLKTASIFLLVGFLMMSVTIGVKSTPDYNLENAYFEGRVQSVARANTATKRYVIKDVKFLGEELNGKVVLDVEEELEIGDRIAVIGSFATIEFNPFDSYSVSKYSENVTYSSKAEDVIKLGEDRKTLGEKIRIKVRKLYLENMGETGGVALGLVFGDTSYIGYDTESDMRASGLSHLFSVSGLHVGFMSTIIFWLFTILKVEKKKSLFWVSIILLAYGFLTGFPVGVVRASIMYLLALVAEIRLVRHDPLNALALTSIILLAINPLDLFSVSFLLSVGAMFGIICFYWSMTNIYKGDNFFIKKVVGAVSVSLSSNVFVFPISCYFFGSVSVFFIIANVLLVPIASLAYTLLVPVTLLALIIEPLGILMLPISMPLLSVTTVSSFIAQLPGSTVSINMPMLGALLFSFGMIVVSKFYMGSKYSKIVLSTLSFIACALIIFLF